MIRTKKNTQFQKLLFNRNLIYAALFMPVVALTGCGDDEPDDGDIAELPSETVLSCDDSFITSLETDSETSVLLVHAFAQGDEITLDGSETNMTAAVDMCLVKILVGPGNPGTDGLPSTSQGIGVEIWLPGPQNWNGRIRNLGGGGWAGGSQTSLTEIGNSQASLVAGQGFVVGTTDTGHTVTGTGSFAMDENGSVNERLWEDFADRALEKLAEKTKDIVKQYYGKEEDYAYWDGCSTGGRQGYKMAQEHPEYYDGYLNQAPAINWTRFITNELYPQIVMQQELGGPIASEKLALVSGAAVSACDVINDQHLGFIVDPNSCAYNPLKDEEVLCAGEVGDGVTGISESSACVSEAEAVAINKIWYGQTVDGTAPDPDEDNAGNAFLSAEHKQLWWGLDRGTNLEYLSGSIFGPFSISSDLVALELQDPTIATPTFRNSTGNGEDGWKLLSYADLAYAYTEGLALQNWFGNINTDNPDLSSAKESGARIISYHGLADQLITADGSINYFNRVADKMGGMENVQDFNRLYLIPGYGHCRGIGSVNGTESPELNANNVPLPAPEQFFNLLMDWVENGVAPPDDVILSSADDSVTMPVCSYPKKAVYSGTGSITDESSYTCE